MPKRNPTDPAVEACPLTTFVSLVSGKWAIPILYRLIISDGAVRFRQLQRLAAPITQKELTKQLRLLEERGLVTRTVYPDSPPRVEYRSTEMAQGLVGALEALAEWTRQHAAQLGRDSGPSSSSGVLAAGSA